MDSEEPAEILWSVLFGLHPWVWFVADQGWMGPDAKKRADVFSSYFGKGGMLPVILLAVIAVILWRVYR
jgi:hypothetical protein